MNQFRKYFLAFGLTETGIATVSTESVARLGSAGKAALGTHIKVNILFPLIWPSLVQSTGFYQCFI